MNKNIFISGVSKGIGKELALYHLKRGDRVYGISRSRCIELEKYDNFYHRSIDLSQTESIFMCLKEFSVLNEVNKIERLYLNAGLIKEISRLDDQSIYDFNYIMSVNLYSYKMILDFFLSYRPILINQVVISSSIAGQRPRAGMSAYAVSKAALNMMIKIYALENPHLFFAVIGLCIFDSSISRKLSSKNQKINQFVELKKLAERFSENGYVVSAQQRAEELIYVLNNINELKLTSGDFFEIRNLIN